MYCGGCNYNGVVYFVKLVTLYDDCDSVAVSTLVKQLERNGLKLVSGNPYVVGMLE